MRPGRLLVLVLVALCLIAVPSGLSGAKFARVDYVGKGVVEAKEGTLNTIMAAYYSGKYEDLRSLVVEQFTGKTLAPEDAECPHVHF